MGKEGCDLLESQINDVTATPAGESPCLYLYDDDDEDEGGD